MDRARWFDLNFVDGDDNKIERIDDKSDQELLNDFAHGCGESLCCLLSRYQVFMLCQCRRIVGGSMHDARDLYSRVTLKIYTERPERIREIRNFGGWLCRVARNLHIDERRTRYAEERRNDNMKRIYEISDGRQNSPEKNVLNEELLKQIDLAFQMLPVRLRAAAELRFVEDASYDFIAASVGITLANARKRVQEARQRLTCYLSDYVVDR